MSITSSSAFNLQARHHLRPDIHLANRSDLLPPLAWLAHDATHLWLGYVPSHYSIKYAEALYLMPSCPLPQRQTPSPIRVMLPVSVTLPPTPMPGSGPERLRNLQKDFPPSSQLPVLLLQSKIGYLARCPRGR